MISAPCHTGEHCVVMCTANYMQNLSSSSANTWTTRHVTARTPYHSIVAPGLLSLQTVHESGTKIMQWCLGKKFKHFKIITMAWQAVFHLTCFPMHPHAYIVTSSPLTASQTACHGVNRLPCKCQGRIKIVHWCYLPDELSTEGFSRWGFLRLQLCFRVSVTISGCLPCCLKLVLRYCCLLSLLRNKYDDESWSGLPDGEIHIILTS